MPKLSQYEIFTNSFVRSLSFASTEGPSRLVKNGLEDELYFINGSVFKFNVSDLLLPTQPFFTKTSENFYGLYVDKVQNEIYMLDAKNYNQQGEVLRVSSLAIVIDKFDAGIIPQNLN